MVAGPANAQVWDARMPTVNTTLLGDLRQRDAIQAGPPRPRRQQGIGSRGHEQGRADAPDDPASFVGAFGEKKN